MRRVAQANAKRESLWQPFDEPDANRTMSLEETPWLETSRGGPPGLSLLDRATAVRVRDESLSQLSARQYQGLYSWFPGGPVSLSMSLRALEGFAEASQLGDSGGDQILTAGLKTMVAHYERDRASWDANRDDLIRLVYIASSLPVRQRREASLNDNLLRGMLDGAYHGWKEASLASEARLALALHRLGRQAEAMQVWESLMDAVVRPSVNGAQPIQRTSQRFFETGSGMAFALRALLELNPSDPRGERLAQQLAIRMDLDQQRALRPATEGLVALAEYLRRHGDRSLSHDVVVETSRERKLMVFEATSPSRMQQLVIPVSGTSVPEPVVIHQSNRGMTLATVTWHYEADHAARGNEVDGCNVARTYYVLRGPANHRAWVPLPSRTGVTVGEDVAVRVTFTVPYPMGLVCLRDPRPAGLEPMDVFSGERWNAGLEAYEETRDNRTSFFFERLTEGTHSITYRMRAATPGRFHAAPATLEALRSPEFQAYSQEATLVVSAPR